MGVKESRMFYIEPEIVERLATSQELELDLAHYAISWGLYVPGAEAEKEWGGSASGKRWSFNEKVSFQFVYRETV